MDALRSKKYSRWFWKSNEDPFDPYQFEQWTPYSHKISRKIDRAFRHHKKEIVIKGQYCIDFDYMRQVNLDDTSRQRPIRRQLDKDTKTSQTEIERENDMRREERLSFPLESSVSSSTTIDTQNDGSPFVLAWYNQYANGSLTFKHIFPLLIEGIREEGKNSSEEHSERDTQKIIERLEKIESIRNLMKLQETCATIYTMQCFLYRLTNKTLRDNDMEKLTTMGPFCYLLYNYVGNPNNYLSLRSRLRKIIRPSESGSMTVYRGATVARETIEQYRQAAGKEGKPFRWFTFVSTSLAEEEANKFIGNVLFVIELSRSAWSDQVVNLEELSFYKDEKEVLLRPGVRFHVDKLKSDENTDYEKVYIKILPSYLSNLR